MNNIEVLLEQLELLKIMNEASEGTNKQTNKEILIAPAQTNKNIQATIPKSMVLDLK